MLDINKIHDKPYHFTLERLAPNDVNVPDAIIPDDLNLHLRPKRCCTCVASIRRVVVMWISRFLRNLNSATKCVILY